MAAPTLPRELTARLLEEGWGPTQIAKYLNARGISATPNAVSQFRRRNTDVPAKWSADRKVPWRIKREHATSIYRQAILAWHQREEGHPLTESRARTLLSIETRLKESGYVIHYSPRSKKGWQLVPARPGIDLGIVREPDGVPRPPTKGPYALLERESLAS